MPKAFCLFFPTNYQNHFYHQLPKETLQIYMNVTSIKNLNLWNWIFFSNYYNLILLMKTDKPSSFISKFNALLTVFLTITRTKTTKPSLNSMQAKRKFIFLIKKDYNNKFYQSTSGTINLTPLYVNSIYMDSKKLKINKF